MADDLFVHGRDSAAARQHFNAEQRGICAICGRQTSRLALDHEHSDLSLCRGLLCNGCNSALGFFDDDIDRLQSAIDYLRRHAHRNACYRLTEDFAERDVKVVQPRMGDHERSLRDQAIVAAVERGEPTQHVADRFRLSVSHVNRIVAA